MHYYDHSNPDKMNCKVMRKKVVTHGTMTFGGTDSITETHKSTAHRFFIRLERTKR